MAVIPAVPLASGEEASVGFPGEREMQNPCGNSVESCAQSFVCSGGCNGLPLVCCRPAQTHHKDWFRTTLNWYRYSTIQNLRVLADSYSNVLRSLASAA